MDGKAYAWCNKHPGYLIPNYDRLAKCPVCGDTLDISPNLPTTIEPIEIDTD